MSGWNRRRFLRWGGLATVVGLAGCQTGPLGDGAGPDGDDEPSETDEPDDPSTDATDTTDDTDDTDPPDDAPGVPTGEGWPLVNQDPTNRAHLETAGAAGDLSVAWNWQPPVPEGATPANRVLSAPIVVDGTVYLHASGAYLRPTPTGDATPTDSRSGRYDMLVAIDEESGEVVWRRDFEAGLSGAIAPVVAGDRLVHAYAPFAVYDRDTGDVRWADDDIPLGYRPPTVVDDDAYLPTLDGLAAVDLAERSVAWTTGREQMTQHPPAVADGMVYAAEGPDVVARSASDGGEQWRSTVGFESDVYNGPGPMGSPVVAGEIVYAATGTDAVLQRDHGGVVALERAGGEERWRFAPEDTGNDRQPTGVYGVPAVLEDRVVVTGWVDGDARALALDPATGESTWGEPVAGLSVFHPTDESSLFVVSTDAVEAVALADGSITARNASGPDNQDVVRPNALSANHLFVVGLDGLGAYER